MLVIKRGQWNEAHLLFFSYRRIYIRGRWTPFCKIKYRKEPKSQYNVVSGSDRKQQDWSFLERVRFMVGLWMQNLKEAFHPELTIAKAFEKLKKEL